MNALTPLAVSHADVLRHLADNPGDDHLAIAKATGRIASNVKRDMPRLVADGLVYDEGELTAAGVDALRALARAEGGEAPAAGVAPSGDSQFLQLRHDQISPDPENARKHFDEDALAELADSMAVHGLKQKVSVRGAAGADGRHQLTMGERRWRAWGVMIADGRWPRDHVEPCFIDQAADDLARAEGGLVENLQREDLNHAEIAEAFEALATTHGRSNKDIADRVGCTAEYVQQHRRLMKLEPEDLDGVREGRWSMHDALRIVANPKPAPLSPLQLLILAEVMAKAKDKPKANWSSDTECAFTAGDDPELKELVKRNMLNFALEDYQKHRSYVGRGYNAGDAMRGPLKAITDSPNACAELLRKLRVEALGEEAAGAIKEGAYATPWLNGPFELTAKAKKAIEADKAQRQKEKAQQTAAKTERAQRLAAFQALDADLRANPPPMVDPRVGELLGRLKIQLPLSLKNGRVYDAKGSDVFNASWRFEKDAEGANWLFATLVNAAAGYGAKEPQVEDEEFSPALQRLAGVRT